MLLSFTGAKAYHIAGGDLTAKWISGQNFEVTLTLFRDCSNSAGAGFDSEIILGIYRLSDNQLYDSVHMSINTIESIGLAGNTCVPPPNVCMEKGDYIRTIQLPPQPGGYYLVWERCCRNSSVINIVDPDAAGMAFYLEIADPALQNSSPVFNSPPLPYSCAEQLFQFHFDATDDDGDSLLYVLSTPLDGGHTSNQNPNPFSPVNGNQIPDPAPYSDIIWAPPFSLFDVCAGTVPVTLDPQSGLMEGTADVIGIYAIAVTVYEYRNGVQIGATRREIEFTVIPCNDNGLPQIQTSFNDLDTTVHASDTLCFFLMATDPDGDTISMIHSGEIFANDPSLSINAPYAQSVDSTSVGAVIVPFCWYTSCDQSRDSAYVVTYEATDNGCPLPAMIRKRIRITVLPLPAAPRPNLLCMTLVNSNLLQIHIAPDTSITADYFSHYTLYRSRNGEPFQAYQQFNTYNLQVFTDSNALANDVNDYCYVLSVTNRCGVESPWSDTLCSITVINDKTNYIRTVSVENNNSVRMAWEDFPDGPYSVYHIYKRINSDGTQAAQITSLANYPGMEFHDYDVAVADASYCYTMINQDVCGNFSAVSNELCTILLNGRSEQFVHHLNWNEFMNWKGGTDHYITERSDYTVTGPFNPHLQVFQTSAMDNNLPVEGGVYAYRIRAMEGGGGYNEESLSNEIILSQAPLAWVPNAFTPNRDGKNDGWGISTAYVENIELKLFNRWGQMVWETSDKTSRWDGTYNGTEAPQDVYYYRLTWDGYSNDKKFEKTGRVTLIR